MLISPTRHVWIIVLVILYGPEQNPFIVQRKPSYLELVLENQTNTQSQNLHLILLLIVTVSFMQLTHYNRDEMKSIQNLMMFVVSTSSAKGIIDGRNTEITRPNGSPKGLHKALSKLEAIFPEEAFHSTQ
ncbi:hypothetical protein VNO77_00728 [Canavalia gladiata]|uniref:Uncharacterized protein n=1 Tax=Canavalia gladiata TaxID=3824 RepID=A0AAN9R5L1_CANGL